MNYFDTDYYFLLTLGRLGSARAEILLRESARELGWMSCADNLASSLSALAADGYATVALTGDSLAADTAVGITEKGREAIQVGGMAKLFSGMKDKAIRKNEKSFCAKARPAAPPYVIDRASFASYAESVKAEEEATFLMIENAEDGLYELSLHHPYYMETADDEVTTGDLSLICAPDGLRRMLGDLLDTALLLTESRKARKIVLFGAGKAYVATFCEVADEAGYAVPRVTVAPILFNRQRFIGKRDSDLDYAQCGDNVLSTSMETMGELCGAILNALSRRTDLLDDALGEKVRTLYVKLR